MPIVLGSVADDYTGASDLANTLTRNGLRTIQTIGVPDSGLALPDVDAIVVALKIRSVATDEAVAAARGALAWLTAQGAAHVLYKICSTFDSTDAGNVGPVIDALRQDAATDIPLVTPAFLETGRTVYMGNLFVGRAPLNESPMKDHPLNPMRDSNLLRVLARQSKGKVGLVELGVVAKGVEAVRARLKDLAASGCTAAIADAVFERDLEVIGEAAVEAKLSAGASGLGLGLARALVKSGRGGGATDFSAAMRSVGGLSAIVAGSCSKATLEQIAIAEKAIPVLRLDQAKIIEGKDEIERALAWTNDRINGGPVLIAASAEPEAVASIQAKYGRDTAGLAIEQATATIVARLIERGVRRLVVAGGETSGAAVDRLGVPAFLIGPEIAAGVPLLRTVGAAQGDLLMALKSGNFGGPDFFEKALAMMS